MAVTAASRTIEPHRRLTVWHAASVCVGMVIGSGIFKSAPIAAANVTSDAWLLAAWAFGGAMSLVGAFCFAELAAAFPDPGGDYFFLRKAYGASAGFLFAWSRFAVIHTGSMALLAFSFGDYLAEVVDLGPYGADALAATTIVALAAVNLAGLRFGIGTQVTLMFVVIGGLLLVIAAGARLAAVDGAAPAALPADPAEPSSQLALGAALVYVFLAYGGWSDAATLSAEMRDRERGMKRALVYGMAAVTLLYLLTNWAYLEALGLAGLAASAAPAADTMRLAFGAPGEIAIVALVAVTSITSINALLIAGARTTYAAARDTAALGSLGRWHAARGTPDAAIIAMALVALALVAFGTVTRGGFATMVDYLSPVYWLFLTSSGVALLVLRRRYPQAERPFRVPFYPLLPIVFVASSAYVLYSSLAYVRVGAIVGVAVLLVGVLLLFVLRRLRGAPRAAA
jgi:basic amino acid/polyamine antiporter, APA family